MSSSQGGEEGEGQEDSQLHAEPEPVRRLDSMMLGS